MQHKPVSKSEPLLPELVTELARIRAARGFRAEWYIAEKVNMLATYLKTHGLKGAVLGLSGGIDSAVVLGLLRETKRLYPDVLTHIVPASMPVHVNEATGQARAQWRAHKLCDQWGIRMVTYDLVKIHRAYRDEIDWIANPNNWAAGQLVSTIRTPALYYTTSLLTAAGTPSVVIGTTNRDEGAYLGYVGKASDGMVDIQLIADLHKSEVREVAKVLGVTQEIMDIAPTGDMYDGRVDEEVFGAPYDFVEMYLRDLCTGYYDHERGYRRPAQGWLCEPSDVRKGWSLEAKTQYATFAANLEALHRYNAHKYLVGSPAVHLNVLPSAVPGGWRE